MKILHVIDTLDGEGSARQLCLLAPALTRTGSTVEVCCVGEGGRDAEELRRRGIAVHVLGWTRWLDVPALWRLRALLRDGRYGLLHVWRLAALRAVALSTPSALPRVIVSSPLPHTGRLKWWDRQALRRVRCVALPGEDAQPPWTQQGLGATRWQAVPAGVAADGATPAAPHWATRYPRRIACAGRLERGRGFREAIWAVDILRYVLPDIHLLIAGTGPRQPDLRAMIDRLDIANAHLLADSVAATEVLGAAEVCWVPSRADRGRQAALEALALGKAVVASDVPCLRSVIRDGETGCLVPPGDPVALARRTHALLGDPDRCARLGQASRADVLARFGLGPVATRWQGLYNDLAA